MNTFADTLFSVLFSGIRSLVEGIWSSVVKGNYSNFFHWLGDHWLWLVLILCLICTAIDFIIWMIRWRPYLVWRTKFRRFLRRMRGETAEAQAFETGYVDGVALDMPEEIPQPWPEEEMAPWPENPPQAPAVLPEEFFSPQLPDAEPPAPLENAYTEQAYFVPQEDSYPPVVQPVTESVAAPRRRRSEKHERRKVSWHERLMADDDAQEAMLDGLPPAVDREQAFHEPVYPQSSTNFSAWKKPENK